MGLSAAVAGAQEPQDGVADGARLMTLRDCMEYAISNSTKIRIGRQNPQYYEVLEGLEPGEKVITSGYDTYGDSDVLVF